MRVWLRVPLRAGANRLQRLRTSDNDKHRRMCEGCLQIKNHGMTYEQALNYAGIPTEEVQEDE